MKKRTLTKPILFTLLILIAAWIGLPTQYGYLHPADALILLAAYLLPTPAAMVSVGLASVAADLLKGYYLLAPCTLIIKLLMVYLTKLLLSRPAFQKHPELAAAPVAAVPVVGFWLGELIFGLFQGKPAFAFATANGTLVKNLIQAGGSILLFFILYDFAMGFIAARRKIREEAAEKEEKTDE